MISIRKLSNRLTWIVKRRYTEFSSLHINLKKRLGSPSLDLYVSAIGKKTSFLPVLPKKTLIGMSTYHDIEQRRRALENYLSQILKCPDLFYSYSFREFINEPINLT